MPNLNYVILAGHLGADPEVKTTESGIPFAKFRLATSYGRDERKKTTWHNCQIWGSQAAELGMSAEKGDAVYCIGRIENREYDGKWYTDIICESVSVKKREAKDGE